MAKIKIISALNAEKNEQYGDTWILDVDAGKGPFKAYYQGKKDLAPLVGKEEEVEIEAKPHFSNKALKFRIKWPKGNFGGGGGKAYNPSPEQQIRMKALEIAGSVGAVILDDLDKHAVIALAKEFEQYIKG